MNKQEVAAKIVKKIEEDILDRRGIGNELEECDRDFRRDIRKTWKEIIVEILENEEKE